MAVVIMIQVYKIESLQFCLNDNFCSRGFCVLFRCYEEIACTNDKECKDDEYCSGQTTKFFNTKCKYALNPDYII